MSATLWVAVGQIIMVLVPACFTVMVMLPGPPLFSEITIEPVRIVPK